MFNIYFAGGPMNKDAHIIKTGANRLYSYANEQKLITNFCAAEGRGPLLVDSGAFSVAHSGAKVDIDSYIKYINENPQAENFIELDVIPYPILNIQTAKDSAEGSWNNYLYMIDKLDDPYKVLPVFHFGENLSYLKQMLEFEYKGKKIPFICIGGRHGVSMDLQEQYFKTIFTTIHNSSNPTVKVHILGMTVFSTLERFPFYSADSTTYLMLAIYGNIMTEFGPITVSAKNNGEGSFRYMSKERQEILQRTVEQNGYTIEQLSHCYRSRVEYNIDRTLEWARSYVYKGQKSFKKCAGLF